MKITFQHTYAANREEVWALLQDEDALVRTLPGCKRLHLVGDGLYETELGLDVGPIKGLFAGHVQMSELEAPARYRLKLSGRGKPGELSADSWIFLEDNHGKTVVTCDADAQVSGLLASVGQRVTGSVARMLLGRFFKNVETELRRSAG
jgi:uncharacterized protein